MATIEAACKAAVNAVRCAMATADGDEEEVLQEFIEQIGSEVDGWEMRMEELKRS